MAAFFPPPKGKRAPGPRRGGGGGFRANAPRREREGKNVHYAGCTYRGRVKEARPRRLKKEAATTAFLSLPLLALRGGGVKTFAPGQSAPPVATRSRHDSSRAFLAPTHTEKPSKSSVTAAEAIGPPDFSSFFRAFKGRPMARRKAPPRNR